MKRSSLFSCLAIAAYGVLCCLAWTGFGASTTALKLSQSLAGPWRFQLDRADVGIQQRWFQRSLPGQIDLPGSLPAAGIGDDISTNTPWTGGIVDRSWFTYPKYAPYRQPGHVKVPFWLQPAKYYKGAAWYQRDIEIPQDWQGKRIVLFLERVHWESRIWVDDKLIGTNNSLSTPHEYELGIVSGSAAAPAAVRRALAPNTMRPDQGGSTRISPQMPTTRTSSAAPEAGALPIQLAPGQHTLTIRVDNRLVVDIGENSHGVTDHTQGNWNGIVGRMELRTTPLVWVGDVQVFPDSTAKKVRVHMTFHNATGKLAQGKISVFIEPGPGAKALPALPCSMNFNTAGTDMPIDFDIPLGEQAKLWDEFSPVLYQSRVNLRGQVNGQQFERDSMATFGLREISTSGTQFLINGRKTFFRGTLECCIFPKTGHPPTDVASWKRIIRIAKAHGLNLIRFHSYCPPEAAFEAADELGFYCQVETCWANQSITLGDGKPVDQWVDDETDRILKHYGNHPSFLLMPYGNEPGGRHANAYLAKYVAHYKALDPRQLWTAGSGWPQLPENQFHVTPDPRIQGWGQGLSSRINARPPETMTDYRDYIQKRRVPVISHEIGQWCVYPNFDEIPKYTGYLKPKNFEIFRDFLNQHHLGGLAHQFLLASGKLQTLCYKEDIESALRTPGMGGFELLDLHDFPGQGSALVGVLDPFWEDKGYVTAEEFRRFCNSTVPLARLERRVFTQEDTLKANLEVAHFGPAPLEDAVAVWKLVDDRGKSWANGQMKPKTIPMGNGIGLGKVEVALKNLPAPARYKLVVGLRDTPFENDWDLWIYPPTVDTQPPSGVKIVDDLTDDAVATLQNGGKVLLLIPTNRVKNDAQNKVALGFSSIFWNTAWTQHQPPTTLGILCDSKDPALADFPTDYHSNWQWWYLVSRAGAMILDELPQSLRPTVEVIDDWFTARKLGLVFEAKLGHGRLVVCSIDLKNGLETNPVARQMRHSLLRYMNGDRFQPAVEVTASQVRSLITEAPVMQKLGLRSIRADSFERGYGPGNAIDGDPHTMWHTAWSESRPGFPHELIIEFQQPVTMRGFTGTASPRSQPQRLDQGLRLLSER